MRPAPMGFPFEAHLAGILASMVGATAMGWPFLAVVAVPAAWAFCVWVWRTK